MDVHRREVREAILDTTWALVTERGWLAVTMSEIAQRTGIGRATLYKYFPDVEAIVLACHQRHVAAHLQRLGELRDQPGDSRTRLRAVLEAYALISHHRASHGADLGALVHRGEQVVHAQQQIIDLIRDLVADGAKIGDIRDDVGPEELARYCLHALGAASSLPSEAAVHRLVAVTLAGLQPPRSAGAPAE